MLPHCCCSNAFKLIFLLFFGPRAIILWNSVVLSQLLTSRRVPLKMHQFLDEEAEEGGYLGCDLLPRTTGASLLSRIRKQLKIYMWT